MPFNATGAANFIDGHAQPHSTNNCAAYVRRAIQWGGVYVTPTNNAKDYGPNLVAAGFYAVTDAPQKGDVVVIDGIAGHSHGHMAMFDGSKWVSDFKQRAGTEGFYPGPDYRRVKPSYTIYRHN
ncbi:CHAP domain-containing protein [Dyella mobilis]|uniref:CHAP domain-containing protein n=1 Tax=Dyella mobilis TaxID=1849582 RepID=A0ABS2KHQ7_9GAMM|nr:CHAP domain-containing protein [Dyella mobilis]MBM7129893.1 CHAP domain-containing protein [Dyella mobilis]GLQ97843.1 hypothetical protein GCM10007863_22630 [Dyella mobilis]